LPFALPFIAWTVVCQCYSAVLRAASSAVGGGVVLASVGMLPCMSYIQSGLRARCIAIKACSWTETWTCASDSAQGYEKTA